MDREDGPRRWTRTALPVPVQLVLPSSAYTPPFREISRPPVARSAPVAGRAAAPGAHLPAQEHGQADDERHANYQRWSQRREVMPHNATLPVAAAAGAPAGLVSSRA